MTDDLTTACALVNRASWLVTGHRSNSVIQSMALTEMLSHRGYRAAPVRVELFVSGRHWQGTADGDPTTSCWQGTVGVVAGGHLLLPAVDQVNAAHRMALVPIVAELPRLWAAPYPPYDPDTYPAERAARTAELVAGDGTSVRASRFYRQQIGLLPAGDTRPSKWWPVYERMIKLEEA